MSFTNRPLAGRSILLLEGARFLASYVADGIRAAGGQVLSNATSAEEANELMQHLRTAPDAVVVDVDIFDADAFLHRGKLAGWNVPLLLISDRPRTRCQHHDVLTTPFASYQVVDHICAKLGVEPTRG